MEKEIKETEERTETNGVFDLNDIFKKNSLFKYESNIFKLNSLSQIYELNTIDRLIFLIESLIESALSCSSFKFYITNEEEKEFWNNKSLEYFTDAVTYYNLFVELNLKLKEDEKKQEEEKLQTNIKYKLLDEKIKDMDKMLKELSEEIGIDINIT